MPIDGQWNADGSRMQGWLRRTNTMRLPPRPRGLAATQLGLVIKRHDKDAETNVNGNAAEYDVLLLYNYQLLYNLPVKGFRLNSDTGDIAILKPAQNLPDISDPTTADVNIMSSDGDLVCIEFVAQRYPIISGTMNHIRTGQDTAPYHPVAADGEQRKLYHKGAEFTIEEDGDILFNVPDNKGVTINVNGTQIFRVFKDGSGIHVELGTTATEALVLGDAFKTWWDSTISGHTHSGVAAGGASTGPMVAQIVVGPEVLPTSTLSTVSKTE